MAVEFFIQQECNPSLSSIHMAFSSLSSFREAEVSSNISEIIWKLSLVFRSEERVVLKTQVCKIAYFGRLSLFLQQKVSVLISDWLPVVINKRDARKLTSASRNKNNRSIFNLIFFFYDGSPVVI